MKNKENRLKFLLRTNTRLVSFCEQFYDYVGLSCMYVLTEFSRLNYSSEYVSSFHFFKLSAGRVFLTGANLKASCRDV